MKRAGLIALVALVPLLWLGYRGLLVLASMPLFGDVITRVETDERVVALTYDDGPLPPYTLRLLEVLERHQVPATFFMLGANIESYPRVAASVLARGHELGNHSYSHAWLALSWPSTIADEVDRTNDLLRSLGVSGDIAFRSPYGSQLFVLPWVLSQRGMTNVLFDVVPADWEVEDAGVVVERVLEATRPGSVILLHDDGLATVEATGAIIEGLRKDGYRFVTVKELLALREARQ